MANNINFNDDLDDRTLPGGSQAEDDSDDAPSLNPMVADYVKKLQAAQQQSNQNQLYSGLARAAGSLSAGMAGGGAQVSQAAEQGYNALDQEANAPVTQVVQQEKAASQAVEDEQAAQQAQALEDANDPDSTISQKARQFWKKIVPTDMAKSEDYDQLSATDLKNYIQQPAEFKLKQDELRQKSADSLAARQASHDDKTGAQQDKSYTQLRHDLETFRGNQSAQQAALAVQNADKALALVNANPTKENLALLADEMGKVAMGGVPSEGGVKALTPDTLGTRLANMKSFISGNPSSADVSGYLAQNRDYLTQIKDQAQSTLNTYRSNLAKGYKNRVKAEDYQEAVQDYGLNTGSTAQGKQAPQAQFPRQLRRGNQVATVSNDAEMKEAQNEGWQ